MATFFPVWRLVKTYKCSHTGNAVNNIGIVFPRYGHLQALKGWKRLGPPRSRLGVRYFVVARIAVLLMRGGHLVIAIWSLMTQGTYFRQSALRRRTLM